MFFEGFSKFPEAAEGFFRVFGGFFAGIGKSSKKGFLRVFWEILGSQSLAGCQTITLYIAEKMTWRGG